MRPGEQYGSVWLETQQEIEDTVSALWQFSSSEGTASIIEQLDSEPPIELRSSDGIMALAALRIAAKEWIDDPDGRGRVLLSLDNYDDSLGDSPSRL